MNLELLISKEKRSYLFASICSALTSFYFFYSLLHRNLYLEVLKFEYFSIVIFFLLIGNLLHGFFACKSYFNLRDHSSLERIVLIKKVFYKSLLLNFFTPYFILIIFFFAIGQFALGALALFLFLMMMGFCYYFDLRPLLIFYSLKREL